VRLIEEFQPASVNIQYCQRLSAANTTRAQEPVSGYGASYKTLSTQEAAIENIPWRLLN